MNTDFDFKVGKLWAAIQGEKKDNLRPLPISCCKNGTTFTFTCFMHPLRICLLNVQLHCCFFHGAWIAPCQGNCSQLTCWWLKGVQTITSIISILKYTRAYIHLHTFTSKHMPTPTRWLIFEFTLWRRTLGRTKGLGKKKKKVYFWSIICNICSSSGLICLLRCDKQGKREWRKRRVTPILFTFCKANLPPSLIISVHFDNEGDTNIGFTLATMLQHFVAPSAHVATNSTETFWNSTFITSPLLPRPLVLPRTADELSERRWTKQRPTCSHW